MANRMQAKKLVNEDATKRILKLSTELKSILNKAKINEFVSRLQKQTKDSYSGI